MSRKLRTAPQQVAKTLSERVLAPYCNDILVLRVIAGIDARDRVLHKLENSADALRPCLNPSHSCHPFRLPREHGEGELPCLAVLGVETHPRAVVGIGQCLRHGPQPLPVRAVQALDIALVVGDQAGKQGDIVEVTVPVAPVNLTDRKSVV